MTFTPNWRPQKQVDFYLSGYRRMKRAANGCPIYRFGLVWNCYYGISANDYLIYGVNEDFIYAGKFDEALGEKKYMICATKTVFLFQAHPFRSGNKAVRRRYIDAIEYITEKPRKHLTKS